MTHTRQEMRRVFSPVVRNSKRNKKRSSWSSYCGGVDLKGELVTPCETIGYLWPNISKTLPQITYPITQLSHEVKGYFNLAHCQTQVIKMLTKKHLISDNYISYSTTIITPLKEAVFNVLRHFNVAIFQAVGERAR